MREHLVKDARALGIIQGAVSNQIFLRIATQENVKAAWDILKQEFVGDKQLRSVKLQGLRRDFEYTRMNDNESLSGYIAKGEGSKEKPSSDGPTEAQRGAHAPPLVGKKAWRG
ncbi:unnamed protein product [Prunus armeniaca]